MANDKLNNATRTAKRRLESTLSHLSSANSSDGGHEDGGLKEGSSDSTSTSSVTTAKSLSIQRIAIFGGGLMGAGIAQVAAQHGFSVTLCDVSQQALDGARAIISRSLTRVAKRAFPNLPDLPTTASLFPEEEEQRRRGADEERRRFVEGVWERIRFTTDAESAVCGTSFSSSGSSSTDTSTAEDKKEGGAQLVIEAIVEDLATKQALFRRLDALAPAECLFATNTSSLSVGDIARAVGEGRRGRFGGLHFFNPVPQMQLVEVVRSDETSNETFETLLDVCAKMGKKAVKCKDTPGFIVNRLLVPFMAEAIRMVERGDATPEDIDIAMRLGAGHPMGPIELTDFVGLDTTKRILDGWREKVKAQRDADANKTGGSSSSSLPEALVQPSPMLEKLVAAGKLGHKTGEGFLKH